MKKLLFLPLVMLLVACSGSNGTANNSYESTIADYVQTDKRGTKYDMKFKAIELKEVKTITVADSIQILSEQFLAEQTKNIQNRETSLKQYEDLLQKDKESKLPSPTMQKKYEKNIAELNTALEAIKQETVATPYSGRDSAEKLAVIVECKYSLVPPTLNTSVEESFYFTLSGDGTKCLSKSRKL